MDGLVTYEPLIADMLKSDIIPALGDFATTLGTKTAAVVRRDGREPRLHEIALGRRAVRARRNGSCRARSDAREIVGRARPLRRGCRPTRRQDANATSHAGGAHRPSERAPERRVPGFQRRALGRARPSGTLPAIALGAPRSILRRRRPGIRGGIREPADPAPPGVGDRPAPLPVARALPDELRAAVRPVQLARNDDPRRFGRGLGAIVRERDRPRRCHPQGPGLAHGARGPRSIHDRRRGARTTRSLRRSRHSRTRPSSSRTTRTSSRCSTSWSEALAAAEKDAKGAVTHKGLVDAQSALLARACSDA